MSQKCFCYTSTQQLPCINCLPAALILCINPDLVRHEICPEQQNLEPFKRGYIEAVLTKVDSFWDSCSVKHWKYTICYDDIQLIDNAAILGQNDIFGFFCKQCKENWVQDLVGNEPYIRIDDIGEGGQSVTFISPHGCEYTFTPGTTVTTGCFLTGSGLPESPIALEASTDPNSVIVSDGEDCWKQVVIDPCGFLHRDGTNSIVGTTPFFCKFGTEGSSESPVDAISGTLLGDPDRTQTFSDLAPFSFTNEEDCDVVFELVAQINTVTGTGAELTVFDIFRSWTFTGGVITPAFARNDLTGDTADAGAGNIENEWSFQHNFGPKLVAPGDTVNFSCQYTIVNFGGATGSTFSAQIYNYFWRYWRA